jgi:VCBS repeat-containing protein
MDMRPGSDGALKRLARSAWSSLANLFALPAPAPGVRPRPFAFLQRLEDRNLLSGNPILVVDTVSDTADGNTSSIANLLANKGADGKVSLREAILAANNTANSGGPDVIQFNIPGGGLHTIQPGSALPTITDPVLIDGWTQSGFSGPPLIELDGSLAGANVQGLTISGGNTTVRGLVINRFTGNGILITGSGNSQIEGNYIGTDATGTVALGNGFGGVLINNGLAGILIYGSASNVIGGSTAASRNIISGQLTGGAVDGVDIVGTGSTGNIIEGNYIGTDVTGTISLANYNGVYVNEGSNNTVGGTVPGAGNLVSGNYDDGVQFTSTSATNNFVLGNLIGTDVTGTLALGNDSGVLIQDATNNQIGGTAPGAANVIAGNLNSGILLFGSNAMGNVIQGNFIGTDLTGTLNLGNAPYGIVFTNQTDSSGNAGYPSKNTVGGTGANAGNTIAHNSAGGIVAGGGSGNALFGNAILANGGLGIDLGNNGVTPNDLLDLDAGANNLQNLPVLTGATSNSSQVAITGSLDSGLLQSYRIEFFASVSQDPSGYGEGERYLGFTTVSTDALGHATFNVLLTASVAGGEFITATATNQTSSDTSEFGANVTAVGNTPPTITSDGGGATANVSVAENTTTVTTVTATDPEAPSQTLTFSIAGGTDAGFFSISSSSGALSFLAPPDFESPADFNTDNVYVVIVQVSDGSGGTDTQQLSVTVTNGNDAPVAVNDSYSTAEDTGLNVPVVGVLSDDTDADGDTLTAVLVSGPAHGSLTLNPDGSFSYTPSAGYSGADSFSYQANDGTVPSATATVSITVNRSTALWLSTVGDVSSPSGAPGLNTWGKDEVLSFGGSSLQFEPGTTTGSFSSLLSLDTLADDGNTDIDALHYVTRPLTIGGAHSINLLPGDLLLSTASDETFASGTFSVKKQDLFLFRPTTPGDYRSGTFQLVLDLTSPGLTDPDLNFGDLWSATLIEQDTLVGDVLLHAGDFLFSRSGGAEDNDIYVFNITDVGAGVTSGTASKLIEGDDIGISAKIAGLELIENTGVYGGRFLSAGTLLVSIDSEKTVGSGVGIAVSRRDVFALNVTQTTLGAGTTVASASLFFQGLDVGLNTNAEALDAFTLVSTGSSNYAPVAANDSYSTAEDTPLNVSASGVLSNDTDVDGDPLTAVLVSGPAHGSLTLNPDGSFNYTPFANYNGPDSFTYQADDGTTTSSTATVSLTITAVNDAPVAVNDSYSTAEDTPLTVSAPGVLSNDTDVDGDPLTAVLVAGPSHGLLTLNPDGSFNYTPFANYNGPDSFTYQADDGTVTSGAATVSLTVIAPGISVSPVSGLTTTESGGTTHFIPQPDQERGTAPPNPGITGSLLDALQPPIPKDTGQLTASTETTTPESFAATVVARMNEQGQSAGESFLPDALSVTDAIERLVSLTGTADSQNSGSVVAAVLAPGLVGVVSGTVPATGLSSPPLAVEPPSPEPSGLPGPLVGLGFSRSGLRESGARASGGLDVSGLIGPDGSEPPEAAPAPGTSTQTNTLIGTGLLAGAGFVLLNPRVGSLLLSMMTAKPTWRQFDPLEILFAWEKEQEEEEETLLTLVEGEGVPSTQKAP